MGLVKKEYMEQQERACAWCDEEATTTIECAICGTEEQRCDNCVDTSDLCAYHYNQLQKED
jgi:hypothetical protein